MKIVKISPKFQITIPSVFRHLCKTGTFAVYQEEKSLVLKPAEFQVQKSDREIIEELQKEFGIKS